MPCFVFYGIYNEKKILKDKFEIGTGASTNSLVVVVFQTFCKEITKFYKYIFKNFPLCYILWVLIRELCIDIKSLCGWSLLTNISALTT